MMMFVMIGYRTFGIQDKDILSAIKNQAGLQWAVGIIGVLLVIGVIYLQFSDVVKVDDNNNNDNGDDNFNLNETREFKYGKSTIFHPKIWGLIIIFVLAAFTIKFLTGRNT